MSVAFSERPHFPLRWWSSEQQSHLIEVMEDLLRAWEQDWGLAQHRAAQSAVRCEPACEEGMAAESAHWKSVALSSTSEPSCEVWWDVAVPFMRLARPKIASLPRVGNRPDPVAVLLEALFGSPSQSRSQAMDQVFDVAEVAVEASKAAWSDLWRRIGQALQVPLADAPSECPDGLPAVMPAPQCFKPWSGALILTFHWCGQELRLLVGGHEVEAFLRHRDALPSAAASVAKPVYLVPLWEAVSSLASTMRAELEPIQMSLGTVKTLRVGDVVELSHPLDKPLLAKAAGGELLCEAFLGKSDGHRAIELLSSPFRAN